MTEENNNIFEAVKVAYKALEDKFAIDIKVLDIKKISSVADYFIIASASNPNQLRAMTDEVDEQLYKVGFRLNHSEGVQSKSWILLDFGNIVVSICLIKKIEIFIISKDFGAMQKSFQKMI